MSDSYYNLSFERSVLSSIIFEPSIFSTLNLSPSVFFLVAHQNIYNAIQSLNSAEKPIDEEFIRIELNKKKKFDERIMVEILTANPISDISIYIIELKKMAKKRDILSAVNKIKSLSEEIDGDELLSHFETTADKLRNDESLDVFSIKSIHNVEIEDPEFICKDWIPIPKRTITIFSAGGGTGKTMAALQLAMRYIKEESFEKKVFLWLSEDPAGLSRSRATDIASKVLSKEFLDYSGMMYISDNATFPVMTFKSSGEGIIRPEFYQMRSKLKPYDLIILDPLIGFFAGDENSNSHARQFMQLFTQWAAKENKTIIFIHHSSKGARIGGESKTRGASAFVDAVRAVYEFEKIKPEQNELEQLVNKSLRRVMLTKDNYNASKHFGFQKDLQLFPQSGNNVIVLTQAEHIKASTKPSSAKIIKTRALPPRKSIMPLGANIRVVDIPSGGELSTDEQTMLEQKIKEAAASGIKFE
jgi:replicative DNA helicase